MAMEPGPHDLDVTRLVYTPEGAALVRPVIFDFYKALDTDFDGFAGHMLVSRHRFEKAWSTWEIHPNGDETVILIAGDVDIVLWLDDTEQVFRVTEPGTYIVVPKGIWHTARPRTVTTMVFLTHGEGTRHAEHPETQDQSISNG